MYYTAISTAGHGIRDQRIGLAESDDLFTWRRVGTTPILLPDTRWYKTLGLQGNPASETWRDPFVFRDPDGVGWHMLVTARAAGREQFDDGVLAYARSEDMLTWEVDAAVSTPAGFGEVEVAQVRVVEGRPVLVFTCHPYQQAPWRKERDGHFSTWSVAGGSLFGPWDMAHAAPFTAEPHLFAAPLVQERSGRWVLVGFRNREPEGIYDFEIGDPVPVRVSAAGVLEGC
jgi:beta-fructofuranosidase